MMIVRLVSDAITSVNQQKQPGKIKVSVFLPQEHHINSIRVYIEFVITALCISRFLYVEMQSCSFSYRLYTLNDAN